MRSIKNFLNDCYCQGPTSEQQVLYVEDKLGITFPQSYRRFLLDYGACFGKGIEIYGITDTLNNEEQPQWVDVLQQTLKDRISLQIPYSYIAISDDGMDHKYYMDTSIINDSGECPIKCWGPSDKHNILIAETFIEFLKYLLL